MRRGADHVKTGTDVVEAGKNGRNCGFQRMGFQRNQNDTCSDQHHVGSKESVHAAHYVGTDGLTADAQRDDRARPQRTPDIAPQIFENQYQTDDLETAACTPAQAPSSIRHNKIALEKVGQILKSTVEKPVVVIILDT